MNYDDTVRKMLEDLQRHVAPYKDYEQLYGSAFSDIERLALERARLECSPVPELEQRYRSLSELAQREMERYKETTSISKHMLGVLDSTSIVSNFMKDHEALAYMAKEAIGASKYWQADLDMYRSLSGESEAYRLALLGHHSDIAELSLIAQENLRRLDWDEIGLKVGMSAERASTAASSFALLLKDYDYLFRSFEGAEYKMASFPPFISKLPPIEIITGTNLLSTISGNDQKQFSKDSESSRALVIEDIEVSLDELLTMLDADLIPLWRGAKEGLRSHNPDRSRHIMVSLRELVTHVLHQTAPGNDVRSWAVDPSFFKDGRPTRHARLQFICRGLNHAPFTKFVSKDVSAHLELIQMLQRGTHELSVGLTDEQLRALIIRTESLVRFVLVIWNSNN
ncbi:MAG: hypothetical protein CSYNP_01877 [Syntrophus sp. SKADARSKE-3]|nr:hypothetical protein [Syntrophus sp. SKADARSKE-3]